MLGLAFNTTATVDAPSFGDRNSVTVAEGTTRVIITQLDNDNKPDLALLVVDGGAASVNLFRNTSM